MTPQVTDRDAEGHPSTGGVRTLAAAITALLGGGLMVAAVSLVQVEMAEAKTPGRTYCFLGRCHRVLTLAETRLRLGRTDTLRASFYDDCARDRFNPCQLTSSGEVFRPREPDNAASPIYPDGTMLLLFYPATGAAVVVRVNNAGPYHSSRMIDVSVAVADALGFRGRGLADVEARVIAVPRADEATYQRRRRYWPVHGPIGTHPSIAAAYAALVRVAELPSGPARADATLLTALPMVAVEPASADAGRTAATLVAAPEIALGAVEPPPALRAADDTIVASALAPVTFDDRIGGTVVPPRQIAVGVAIELAANAAPGQRPAEPVAMVPAVARLRGDEALLSWAPAAARGVQATRDRSPDPDTIAGGLDLHLAQLAPAIARGSLAPATAEADRSGGVLARLRARARRGVTPGRLPDISVEAATTWVRRAAVSLAQHARTAARSGAKAGPRLAAANSDGEAPRPISRR